MKKLTVFIQGLILSSFVCSFALANKMKGKVAADGSSTVYPISEAVSEEFQKKYPRVRVTVGVSGTGGGFKKFIAGETDISNASREMKSKELDKIKAQEKKTGKKFEYMRLEVAYDGITVVVNKKSKIDSLSVAQLRKLWNKDSKVSTWKEIDPNLPASKVLLYGPGPDSGTFDYFTKVINGKSGNSRADYTASEDDNVLVRGVAQKDTTLGYFGYAYYLENKDKLRAVAIKADENSPAVQPTATTINNGSYKPLSRPIFIFVSKTASNRPAVAEYIRFYLQNAGELAKEVGYIPLSPSQYKAQLNKWESWRKGGKISTGSVTGEEAAKKS